MEENSILKLLGLGSESLDPKVQMEYDQVNNNIRALADIRFKLLALVPALSGVATFVLSRTLVSDLEPSQYAIGLVVSLLGFLVALGLTIYDQRNSEIYNALGGRAKYLEYLAGLTADPLFSPQPKKVGGQYLEKPGTERSLLSIIPAKHDIGLALIYGSILGAWFFPMSYALLALLAKSSSWFDAHVPLSWRAGFSLAIAVLMVAVLVADLIRLDGKFSNTRCGMLTPDAQNPELFRIEYAVRGEDKILWGKPRSRFTVEDKDEEEIEMPVMAQPRLVKVWYKNNWRRANKVQLRYVKEPGGEVVKKEEVNKIFWLRFLD